MPSHPDRVRRNYHDIEIREYHDIPGNIQVVTIRISKADIASTMSQQDLQYLVYKKTKFEIESQYKVSK